MSQEKTTVARPYAEAVFRRAQETDSLDSWSDFLNLLGAVVEAPEASSFIGNPKVTRNDLEGLLVDLCSVDTMDEEKNLIRLLLQNGRLTLAPEIASHYERLMGEHQGRLQVQVSSAFEASQNQQTALTAALERRLRCQVKLISETDPSLIGGVLVRAGDLVIDASVKGQLQRLASELRI
jgi:F-type H+-transporting ATPase subunit delta